MEGIQSRKEIFERMSNSKRKALVQEFRDRPPGPYHPVESTLNLSGRRLATSSLPGPVATPFSYFDRRNPQPLNEQQNDARIAGIVMSLLEKAETNFPSKKECEQVNSLCSNKKEYCQTLGTYNTFEQKCNQMKTDMPGLWSKIMNMLLHKGRWPDGPAYNQVTRLTELKFYEMIQSFQHIYEINDLWTYLPYFLHVWKCQYTHTFAIIIIPAEMRVLPVPEDTKNIFDTGYDRLFEKIKEGALPNLKNLILNNAAIDKNILRKLMDVIRSGFLTQLNKLDLSYNDIGKRKGLFDGPWGPAEYDDSFDPLLKAVHDGLFLNLHTLILNNTNVSDQFLADLNSIIKMKDVVNTLPNLKELTLVRNNFTEHSHETIQELISAFPADTNLKFIADPIRQEPDPFYT